MPARPVQSSKRKAVRAAESPFERVTVPEPNVEGAGDVECRSVGFSWHTHETGRTAEGKPKAVLQAGGVHSVDPASPWATAALSGATLLLLLGAAPRQKNSSASS